MAKDNKNRMVKCRENCFLFWLHEPNCFCHIVHILLLYWCYDIGLDLINKTSIINWFPNSFSLILGHLQEVCIFAKAIGLVGRMFTNGPGALGSIPGRIIPKTLKMVLDTSLLNTQQYKVCIESKVEQSWERSSTLLYTLV